ncbi:Pyrophosphatase PpaX [Tritonibacter multivorans]|uniref:phosphoglycolate phosphatase n=1 Tax=Tritonibacter multivorans TaxID=928856 RepID=A0A0P1G0N5_9RHOB|nr:HAD family hydrolase [Tritonibacter multivorans]MDA7419346.1 HAD family hydrolase [Tritonibacter multivorans]CUH75279.1 Pyrophosphatase PpaX [Tritonibacter multivorans]SFD21778.1 phosphoglycolate phosphatase [Tritonibacter multivorans]
MTRALTPIEGLLFDKDGTLFDFARTWNNWSAGLLADLAGDNAALLERLAAAIDYDLDQKAFLPGSIAIAGTTAEIAEVLVAHLPAYSAASLEAYLHQTSAEADLAEAVPLPPFLDGLRTQGLRLGVMTNDGTHSTRRHLERSGVFDHFDKVICCDSGYGAKPAPDPLLAFATAMTLPPAHVAMVGDSLHDLQAGRAAGMVTIGVLTGMAGPEQLAPFADVVLPDIGHIPAWLAE